jgi:hypothetical protein
MEASMEKSASDKSKSDKSSRTSKDETQPTLIGTAIDASFQDDLNVRKALTENLKPRRASSEAINARLDRAFEKFNPATLSVADQDRRHFVAPGADPANVLDAVITQRVKQLRASDEPRGLTLRDTAELKRLIKSAPKKDDSSRGVIDLGELISFINRKSRGSSLTLEAQFAPLTAELEAEKLIAAAEAPSEAAPAQGVSRRSSALEASVDDRFVQDSVNVQMESVTSPESQLSYGKIPNGADDDKAQKAILETFQLRPGASDVTSYHDFHTLQIAFQHVWSRIFDGQLTTLGRDLYREYVRLKDFSGSTAPDIPVGSLADLRRLIDEVKKLSQFVDEEIPANLRPPGSEPKNSGLPTPTPGDVAKGVGAVATGGASLFIEWAFNELIKAGNRPVRVSWSDFPLKLNEGTGNIIELRPPVQAALPPGSVEIVLATDPNAYKKKMVFQQWDASSQRPIYTGEIHNFVGGSGPSNRMVLNATQMATGTLKFISEDQFVNELLLGRYVLGDLAEVIKDGVSVTFHWKGVR